jgi:hypothetical protein
MPARVSCSYAGIWRADLPPFDKSRHGEMLNANNEAADRRGEAAVDQSRRLITGKKGE